MKLKEILAKGIELGAQGGSPYTTETVVASNVEGRVSLKPDVAYTAYQFIVSDETGTKAFNIASGSYKPARKKYDIAVQVLDRDLKLSSGDTITAGTKFMRAV